MPTDAQPVTIPDFLKWKTERRRIAVLTAYDFPSARLLDAAGVDCILVGDSLGTVVQGWETTLRVTIDQIIYHAEMVARAARRALVVADLPFLSYQVSPRQALKSAGRILKETNCQAVKLEGGRKMAATIKAIVDADIPVMGHVGLRPQAIRRLGTYKVQRSADEIMDDALAVAESGAFAVVLECIPRELAAKITAQVTIPTIGIGAGPHCDGQVLVFHDMLGMFEGHRPKFVRQYADLGQQIKAAVAGYVADVGEGRFPRRNGEFSVRSPSKEPCRPEAEPHEPDHPGRTREQAVRSLRGRRAATLARRGRGAGPERRGLGRSSPDAQQISRSWTVKNFMAGIDFFNKVAALAEEEGHHPDLHLEGYRQVTIVLWTHAVGGLTENDFILAAKINQVPVQVRRLTAVVDRQELTIGESCRGHMIRR